MSSTPTKHQIEIFEQSQRAITFRVGLNKRKSTGHRAAFECSIKRSFFKFTWVILTSTKFFPVTKVTPQLESYSPHCHHSPWHPPTHTPGFHCNCNSLINKGFQPKLHIISKKYDVWLHTRPIPSESPERKAGRSIRSKHQKLGHLVVTKAKNHYLVLS